MDLATLKTLVQRFFAERAAQYGLDSSSLSVEYVLNWGGFGNPSFKVSDGTQAYHLKLTDWPPNLPPFERQFELRDLLSGRYHAPPLLARIELPGTAYLGLLYERVSGRHADLAMEPRLVAKIMDVLGRLHGDAEVASRLPAAPGARCQDTFVDTYIERFDEDLDTVEPERPEFVSAETLAWMRAETRWLEETARASAAFTIPASSPIHGDVWSDNLLVTEDGRWYLLDWDGLAIGDPALDWAMVLAPEVHYQNYTWWRDDLPPDADEAFAERVALYQRAWLLDWVIDVLADYVDADLAPEHAQAVRAGKREQHLRNLVLYRERYP